MLPFVSHRPSALIMLVCAVALGGSLAGCSSASPAESLATAIKEQAVKLDDSTASVIHNFEIVNPDSAKYLGKVKGTRTHPGTIKLKDGDKSWRTVDGVEGYELKSPDGREPSNTIIVVDGDKCTSLKGDRSNDGVFVSELPSCPEPEWD